ncbi:MAG: tetratricopeptide repeat protein [Thiobacillaceae bacterium]
MSRNVMISLVVLGVALIASGSADAADPTLEQVYHAATAGKMGEALGMMDQVLHDHPNSAKAHFVEAELMAKQGRLADAKTELSTAQHLAPGLPFATSQAVLELQARLSGSRGESVTQPLRADAGHGFPLNLLVLGIGLVAFILLAARFMMRRTALPMGGSYGPAAPIQPYGGGGVAPMGGGMGSGILGGLATGAAVGGGMVAGEALMHHFLDGNSGSAQAAPLTDSGNFFPAQDDMGGSDFGISDASWDSSSGMGGDDWS